MSGRIQASRGSVLFSTNAAEVFDDEANRQQLEQVSQQMEDAIQKEKLISNNHQVTASTNTWDTNKQMPADMPEERMLQSKTPEMNEINKKVTEQSRQHIGDDLEKQKKTNPIGFATDGPSSSYNSKQRSTNENMYMSNPMDRSKVIDQVKGVASGAAGLATGAMNVAAGAAKVIQQSAKSTMDGAKDMMKPSNDTIGNTKDAKKQQEQRDRQGSNSGGATQAG